MVGGEAVASFETGSFAAGKAALGATAEKIVVNVWQRRSMRVSQKSLGCYACPAAVLERLGGRLVDLH